MSVIYIIATVISVLVIAFATLAFCVFNDKDPDQQFYYNYAILQCPHTGEKTDVVVNSCVTCETVHTVCDDCGQVLNVRHDC